MKVSKEKMAWILAQLMVIYSAFVYAIPNNPGKEADFETSSGVFFQSPVSAAASSFLQQKTAESLFHAWKVEFRFHAESIFGRAVCESPLRKIIRKILVINSLSFRPCKSILFFPYHEFP